MTSLILPDLRQAKGTGTIINIINEKNLLPKKNGRFNSHQNVFNLRSVLRAIKNAITTVIKTAVLMAIKTVSI